MKFFPRSNQVITQNPVSTLLQQKTQMLNCSAKHTLCETQLSGIATSY